MKPKKILSIIEDKDITLNDEWYFHATSDDINTIKNILEEGIKSGYLRNKKGNSFNGQYYISLYKDIEEAKDLKDWLIWRPKFIIQDISPYYADRHKLIFRKLFINTRIPLRTSEWDGEFQQYLQIDPTKIVALEYSLSHMISNADTSITKWHLKFVREMVLCLQESNKDLPIYDMSSKREINKEKILSLTK